MTVMLETTIDVNTAVSDFTRALADCPQFQAFEQAAATLDSDASAQQAIAAYQNKRQSLQAVLMLNAVNPKDRAELTRLEQEFYHHPTIAAYLQAQQELTVVCQAVVGLLSDRINLDFAAACRPAGGCCG
jgi:cell fate (sporulation/competence/biofilm development) regulator YlbF (YheA/YmcA/DUF963 family)